MGRALLIVLLCLVSAVAGALGAALLLRPVSRPRPDPAAVVAKVREVARLEALDVSLYKKVSFDPDPPAGSSLWEDVVNFAKFTLRRPSGKALLFATAHLSLDLSELDERSLKVEGDVVEVTLPKVVAQIELLPGETEVLGSNLNAQETAELFELAKGAFQREVEANAELKERARASAERSIRALLLTLGFREVRFPRAPALAPPH